MIKTTTNHRLLLMTAIMLAGVLATSNAQALQGNFKGTISEKLKVEGCGSDTDSGSASLNLKSNNTWKAVTDDKFKGKYKKKSGGSKLVLALDSNSEDKLIKNIKNWAKDLCGTSVKIKDFNYEIKLKFNKKRTALSGTIQAWATGSTSSGSGKGKYKGKVKIRK